MMEMLHELSAGALGAALNGVYQGLLLTVAAALGLHFFGRTNATTRYAVGLTALLIVAALPLLHGALGLVRAEQPEHAVAPPPKSPASPAVVERPDTPLFSALLPSPEPREPVKRAAPVVPKLVSSPARSTLGTESGLSPLESLEGMASSTAEIEAEEAGDTLGSTPAIAGLTLPSKSIPPPTESTISPPDPSVWNHTLPYGLSLGVLGLWGLVALVRLTLLMRQYAALYRLKQKSRPAPPTLENLFQSLIDQMGVRRRTRLLVSGVLASPVLAGFGSPTVLLPQSLVGQLKSEEWEHILRHELGHVCRRDDWTNLLMQVIRVLLFFHPAVWWWWRRLAVDREVACDDYVLAQAERPGGYAMFLTEFAGRTKDRHWSAAPGAWSHKSQLRERIGMILDEKRNISTRLAPTRAGVMMMSILLLAALTLHLSPRIALAQDAAPRKVKVEAESVSTTPAAENAGGLGSVDTKTKPRMSSSGIQPAGERSSILEAREIQYATESGVSSIRSKSGDGLVITESAGSAPGGGLNASGDDGRGRQRSQVVEVRRTRSTSTDTDPIEARLERLERLVESLIGETKRVRGGESSFSGGVGRSIGSRTTAEPRLPEERRQLNNVFETRETRSTARPKGVDFFGEVDDRHDRINSDHDGATLFGREHGTATENPPRQFPGFNDGGGYQSSARYPEDSHSYRREAATLEAQRRALDDQRHALRKQLERLEKQIRELDRGLPDAPKPPPTPAPPAAPAP